MGCGASTLTPAEKLKLKASKKIDHDAAKDHIKDVAVKKLLLLGAGESGKSTLFKQMIELYGSGFPDDERKSYTQIVYNNTMSCVKIILRWTDELKQHEIEGTAIDPNNLESKQYLMQCKTGVEINDEIASHIKKLWNYDEGFKKTVQNRSKYQLPDSADYFFDRIDVIASNDYLPTKEDILRSRVRTTGIVETQFEIDNNVFKMFDVGGQRNERKKWIHCFENVTAVIFVAAISEYDQTLYEDETVSRMEESINLFDEICNSKYFQSTNLILFLNKRDLFETKLKTKPITVYFKEYKGDINSVSESTEYIRSAFEAKNRSPNKEIYTHITTATDTDNISHVFGAVKDTIIKSSLREGGLM